MTRTIRELKKLAWIETVVPNIGGLAPTAEKAIRRGVRLAIQDAIEENPSAIKAQSDKRGKDGNGKHVSE